MQNFAHIACCCTRMVKSWIVWPVPDWPIIPTVIIIGAGKQATLGMSSNHWAQKRCMRTWLVQSSYRCSGPLHGGVSSRFHAFLTVLRYVSRWARISANRCASRRHPMSSDIAKTSILVWLWENDVNMWLLRVHRMIWILLVCKGLWKVLNQKRQ